MIELPGLWSLTPAGFGIGVVAIFYWMLASGRLIPRSSHDREMKQANVRGDEWKETALVERAGRTEAMAQNTQLIEANKAWKAVFDSAAPGVHFGDTVDTVPKAGA